MDLNQLANLGEFVGGVAVIATLAFLGVQMRQANQMARLAASQQLTESAASFFDRMIDNPARNDIWFQGLSDFSSLTVDQFNQFHAIMGGLCRRFEAAAYYADRGKIETDFVEGMEQALINVMRLPGARAWWDLCEPLYNQAFRDAVRKAHAMPEDAEWVRRFYAHRATLAKTTASAG